MNKLRVSIVMMSTFSGRKFKGPQMPDIVNELDDRGVLANCYGIYDENDKRVYNDSICKKLITTRLVSLLFSINRLMCMLFHSQKRYYYNERIFGILALFNSWRIDGDIVVLKPRPAFLVKYFSKKGKKIVIEASENHPEFTRDCIVNECKRLGISVPVNTFTDKKSVQDYINGLMYSDRLLCLTNYSARTYVDRKYPEDKILVTGLSVSCEKVLSLNSTQEVIFICVANHGILKGTHNLVELWNKRKITAPLLIIGELYDDFKSVINFNDINPKIKFLGSRNRKEIDELLINNKCVNVLLSFSESYGRTVYEALCKSVPVIVTETCTCDLVRNGYNGFVVKDEESLVNAIEFFINAEDDVFKSYEYNAYDSIANENNNFGKRYVDALIDEGEKY